MVKFAKTNRIYKHALYHRFTQLLEAFVAGLLIYGAAGLAIRPEPHLWVGGCLAVAVLFLLGIRGSRSNPFLLYALLIGCSLSLIFHSTGP